MRSRDAIELVGLIAIVGSLVFVGLQLRQDRVVAEANQYQARAEMRLGNIRALLESDSAIPVMTKAEAEGRGSLSDGELAIYRNVLAMEVVSADNNFYQYQLGLIEEEYWQGFRQRLKFRLRTPDRRAFYNRARQVLSASFSAEIASLIAEVEQEKTK